MRALLLTAAAFLSGAYVEATCVYDGSTFVGDCCTGKVRAKIAGGLTERQAQDAVGNEDLCCTDFDHNYLYTEALEEKAACYRSGGATAEAAGGGHGGPVPAPPPPPQTPIPSTLVWGPGGINGPNCPASFTSGGVTYELHCFRNIGECQDAYAAYLGVKKNEIHCDASINSLADKPNWSCNTVNTDLNVCCICDPYTPVPAPVPVPAPTPTAPVPVPTNPVPVPTNPVPVPTNPVPVPTNPVPVPTEPVPVPTNPVPVPTTTNCESLEDGRFCVPAADCTDENCSKVCDAANPTCQDISQDFTCATADYVCCSCVGTGGNDPWMTGLQGQSFLFDGEDNHWYSLLHDPEKINVNMRIYSPVVGEETTFINGAGITFYDEDGEEHRIAFTVKDAHNFKPTCPKGEVCLGNGALELQVDGVKLDGPGYHTIGSHANLALYNTPWECKAVPKAHKDWEQVQLAMAHKQAKGSRRLTIFEPELELLNFLRGDGVFEPEKCQKWIDQRQINGDLFRVNAEHSSFYLSLGGYAVQIEFVFNTDPRWIDHQRFDITLHNYKPTKKEGKAISSGVLGETAELKYDSVLGTPILEDRDLVLSGPDTDYEVEGPFGTEFKALKRSPLRKHFSG